jgi:hypothetical protein
MRTQLPVLLVAIVLLVVCGGVAIQRAIQLGQSVQDRRAALVAISNNASEENLPVISPFAEESGAIG